MSRFPHQFTQQVQAATDIVDLIGQYLALKKSGREFVGLCPFHDDHKPSMYVSPSKQMFKCFVCGAGGSVFKFVMLYEKVEFPEAVRLLAQRANIPLPQESSAPADRGGLDKNDLLAATAFAAKFFRSQLRGPAGASALKYALGRGLTEDSIERFGLGYAPAEWDALYNAARRNRISEQQLLTAGLAIRRNEGGGCYDRFRNRLMFPIHDVSGAVIAFGGRALAADERAKYINSPESPLFDKGHQLYGLNWARESIVTSHQAIVVEGYLDVLLPVQAGVANVVATLGTALTDRHVRLLSRYAQDVVLIFDADAAGQAASDRALEIFLSQQIHARVAAVPAGKDPCDYVNSDGPEPFRALIAAAPDALQYAWDRRYEQFLAAGGAPSQRTQVVEEFLRLVATSSAYGAIDAVKQGQLAQHIGHLLNLPAIELQAQMRRLGRRVPRQSAPARAAESGDAGGSLAERHVLEVLLNRPDLFDSVVERVDPGDFAPGPMADVARQMWDLGLDGSLRLEDLLAREALADHGALIASLAFDGERRGNYEATLEGAVAGLTHRRQRQEMERLKAGGYSDETLQAIADRARQADRRRHPKIT